MFYKSALAQGSYLVRVYVYGNAIPYTSYNYYSNYWLQTIYVL